MLLSLNMRYVRCKHLSKDGYFTPLLKIGTISTPILKLEWVNKLKNVSFIMGRPKTQKNFYAVTRGLNDISGIFKEWNECSKVVLISKAAIYQGCTTYEQAKEILALTGGTFQIYIDGCFIPCSEYEKNMYPKHWWKQ